ncbi:MAG: GNAT family N-acetyltransferase [Spirosomataceae bacterium]
MLFRKGNTQDLEELQQLFVETVSEICRKDYTDEQIKVWVSGIENKERWLNILANQYVLIAQIDSKIVGFCTLENHTYIDLFYVHKDFQGQGIAKSLYLKIEKQAISSNQKKLSADVSITAKPFFEKVGFRVITEQKVVRKDVELINYQMEKMINIELNS